MGADHTTTLVKAAAPREHHAPTKAVATPTPSLPAGAAGVGQNPSTTIPVPESILPRLRPRVAAMHRKNQETAAVARATAGSAESSTPNIPSSLKPTAIRQD
jgi:hypothetical protein